MKCLVLGGTRYFGKQLVRNLLEDGHEVTILSRGQTKDPFGSSVQRITADRTNEDDLNKAFKNKTWDIAYDQICYAPNDARTLCNSLTDKIERLIFVSSQSVYAPGANLSESAFDAAAIPISWGDRENFSYVDGKRFAEAVYTQTAPFPVTSVRLPIVLGSEDYTKRLHFHVARVSNRQAIHFPSIQSKISFVSSTEAAACLHWLANHKLSGSLNACSPDPIALQQLMSLIESKLNQSTIYADQGDEANSSPFGIESDWYMSTRHIESQGFHFSKLNAWLPALIEDLAQNTAS